MEIKEWMPLFATALGLTPVVLKWLGDRSIAAAGRREIQQAKELVEFWSVWLQAQREVSSDDRFADLKADVARRLDSLVRAQDERAGEDARSTSTRLEQGPTLVQRTFLAYLPSTTYGWVLHTMFYIVIAMAAMSVFGASIPPDDPNAVPSWEQLRSEPAWVIWTLFVLAVPAFVLQRFANRAERRHRASIRESSERSTG